MATIGTLSLEFEEGESTTAIAVWFAKNPSLSVDHKINGWSVSLRAGQPVVVARSRNSFARGESYAQGLEAVEQALDLICYQLNEPLLLEPHNESRLVIETVGGERVMTLRYTHHIPMRAPVVEVLAGEDGTTKSEPSWKPVLRYYRLSQTRDNMFDAYRYMFLAFEAFLYSRWPLYEKPREKEIAWLTRAVREFGKSVRLERFVATPTSDAAVAFVKSQYTLFRLPLFHAKKSSMTLPHEGLSEKDVAGAYGRLTRAVREGLTKFFGFSGQAGAITHAFFQDGLTRMFEKEDVIVVFSSNNGICGSKEHMFSSGSPNTTEFDRLEIEPASKSDTRLVTALLDLKEGTSRGPIYNLGVRHGDETWVYAMLDTPLSLEGISVFRVEMEFRLTNLNWPRWA